MAITTNVPSNNFEDLQRDVQDATRFTNATAPFTNRVGQSITPIPMRDSQLAAKVAEAESAVEALGWFPVAGSFTDGGTITARNQVLFNDADSSFYSWSGALPKVVPAASTPASTGGISTNAWVNRGDGALRSALAAPDSTVLVGGVPASALAKRYASTVNIRDYEHLKVGDDWRLAMEAAHATGRVVYYPGGTPYKFTRLTTTIYRGGIVGDGMTETILDCLDASSGDAMVFDGRWENFFRLETNSVFTFRDFGFQHPDTAGVSDKIGGASIVITAPIAEPNQRENQGTSFERVYFRFPYIGIHFVAASFWRVSGCIFNSYVRCGVLIENRYDADSGDGAVNDGCVFVTNPTASGASAVIQRSSGGFRFSDSKVLGGTYGYYLDYNTTNTEGAKATSNLHINNVSFELMQFGAISLNSDGIHPFKLIQITSSHVALTTYGIASDSSGSFNKITITGNNIELWGGYAASGQFGIGLNGANNVTIGDNTFGGVAGDSVAISLTNCTGKIGVNTYTDFAVDPIAIAGGSISITKDVQTGTATATPSGWAGYGPLFRSGVESVTFPMPFQVAPSAADITLTAGDGTTSVGGIVNTVSKTGFTYLAIGTTANVAAVTRWEARGVI